MINLVRITTFIVAIAMTLFSMFHIDANQELALAHRAYSKGDMDQAMRMARRANRASSETNKKTEAFYLQAQAASKLNWTKEAKAYLDQLLLLDQEHTQALLFRGELEYQLGEHQKALRDFDAGLPLASESMSSKTQAYFLTKRGLTLLALNQIEKAQSDALMALELATNLPEAHDLMSKVSEVKGDIKKALDECEQAYQLSLEKDKRSFMTPEGRKLSDRLLNLKVKYLRSQ